jgi:hypothetical protein
MEFPTQEHHSMVLETAHPTGADEWYCPICGRRFLLQIHPKFKKIVLEPGDEYAFHSASNGDLDISFTSLNVDSTAVNEEGDHEPIDDESLLPWMEWMDKVDFDQLWNAKD